MFKKTFLSLSCAAALAAGVAPAYAASTFHLVVPLSRATAPQAPADAITVSLAGAALPKATVNQTYSESLRTYLSVTGDAAFDPADARWSLVSGTLPAGLSLDLITGQIAGTPSVLSESGASFDVAVTYKDKSARQTYTVRVGAFSGGCNAYLQANPGAPSGWYTLDPDGDGPEVAQSYYCDMTSDGGGWTRIVRQTEAEPVTNWKGGVNGDSYALASGAIPAHIEVAFGKDEQATFIDYMTWNYTVGEISPTTVTSPKTGKQYVIYRYNTKYYNHHDPRGTLLNQLSDAEGTWGNSLAMVDKASPADTAAIGWAFSPNNETAYRRGYKMQTGVWTVSTSYAWTVWVR